MSDAATAYLVKESERDAPRSRYVEVLGHELHYLEWGERSGRPLIMWHGLARTGFDYCSCAPSFAALGFWVVAPSTIGRGRSSWASEPSTQYTTPYYAQLATAFVDALGIDKMAWVGTSMGGLIGMACAAYTLRGRITHLVLNDVGPQLNPDAVLRIKDYVAVQHTFASHSDAEAYFRKLYAPFGELSDGEWRTLAESSTRRLPDGRFTEHFDPRVMEVFRAAVEEKGLADAWPVYDLIECPTLMLRGALTDLVLPEAAAAMTTRGPKCALRALRAVRRTRSLTRARCRRARVVEVPGCGHAPFLNTEAQVRELVEFFGADGSEVGKAE